MVTESSSIRHGKGNHVVFTSHKMWIGRHSGSLIILPLERPARHNLASVFATMFSSVSLPSAVQTQHNKLLHPA